MRGYTSAFASESGSVSPQRKVNQKRVNIETTQFKPLQIPYVIRNNSCAKKFLSAIYNCLFL